MTGSLVFCNSGRFGAGAYDVAVMFLRKSVVSLIIPIAQKAGRKVPSEIDDRAVTQCRPDPELIWFSARVLHALCGSAIYNERREQNCI